MLLLCGCDLSGNAPSLNLVGAFFPAWLVFGGIGMLAALLSRVAFVALGLDAILPFRLFAYTSVGVIVAGLGWLLCFGPAP